MPAYLDHVATTPLRPAALAILEGQAAAFVGHPSSAHRQGQEAKARLEACRTRAAELLGLRPRSVIFTSGGTEALSIGLLGLARGRRGQSRRILVSGLEHGAVLGCTAHLGTEGFEPVRVAVSPQGLIDLDSLEDELEPGAAVAALILASHEVGTVQPLPEAAALCEKKGVPLVVDAALAPGRLPLPRLPGPHLLAFSAHKAGGPPGVGLLGLAGGIALQPVACGGIHEEGLRAGVLPVPALEAAVAALEAAVRAQPAESNLLDALLSTTLRDLEAIDDVGRLTPGAPSLPGVATIVVDGVEGEALAMALDLRGFSLASGSACALGGTDPFPSLLAMGLDRARAASTIRISMGWNSTPTLVPEFVKTFAECVAQLRRAGPYTGRHSAGGP